MIVWWSGRGYVVLVITIAVLCFAGPLANVLADRDVGPGIGWGMGLLVAAGINWRIGRKINSKRIALIRSTHWHDKLVYQARHRFLSLPAEFWSIPLALAGLWGVFSGLV